LGGALGARGAVRLSVNASKGSSTLDKNLDADGDGIITAEEWEEERAGRGVLGNTTVTTKFALAQDYPGATVKNRLGPRNPHMLNTPFTNVGMQKDPPSPTSQVWGLPPSQEKTAAQLFEESVKKGSVVFSAAGPYVGS